MINDEQEQHVREKKASLINRKQIKCFALELAQTKYHKFDRVSRSFLNNCEAWLRAHIVSHVSALPSKGKTIK
jgi:hypothetical protein